MLRLSPRSIEHSIAFNHVPAKTSFHFSTTPSPHTPQLSTPSPLPIHPLPFLSKLFSFLLHTHLESLFLCLSVSLSFSLYLYFSVRMSFLLSLLLLSSFFMFLLLSSSLFLPSLSIILPPLSRTSSRRQASHTLHSPAPCHPV